MSAIIRDVFRVKTLTTFINSLTVDSLYLGIARPQFWDTIAGLDTIVPTPTNTNIGINSDWDDMLALKRLNVSDVISGIFKEMWQANVVYDIYRTDWDGTRIASYNGPNISPTMPSSLSDVKFYVVTANYNIYACIKHLVVNGVPQPSLYSPDTGISIGTNTGVVKTADSYYWKFIAATSPADLVKFSSTYYHPLETLSTAPAPADPYYTQWTNQTYSASFKGGIYTINVLSQGSGYNGGIAGNRVVSNSATDTQFSVIGNGIGLQYTVIYGAGGSIVDVEVENPGRGYTQAIITTANGTGGSFEIIFSPMTGFGCDPLKDLVARYLLIDTTLTGAEGNGIFTISNEYRKLALIINPYNFGTTSSATSADLDASITLNMGLSLSLAAYPSDAIITGTVSGAKGRVVDFNTVTGNLRIIRTSSENFNSLGASASFQVNESITSVPGTGNATIASISNPSVQKYTGDIIYSEYRAPVLRSALQTEDIKVVVRF